MEVKANNFIHILPKIDTNVTHIRGLARLEYYIMPADPNNSFICNQVELFHVKNTQVDFDRDEKTPTNRK